MKMTFPPAVRLILVAALSALVVASASANLATFDVLADITLAQVVVQRYFGMVQYQQ